MYTGCSHQVNVLRRRSPNRLAFSNLDHLIFAGLYAVAPRIVSAWRLSSPRRSSVGIVPAFACSGVGSRSHAAADQRCRSKFAG